MRINAVEIKNFCQIAARSDTFEPGVICIRGPNGAGKSNYMKALLYALTGSSSNVGKKEDDLKWGAEKGSVKLHFSRGGVEGVITRDIVSAKCSMKYGEQKYKSAKEVDGAIYSILGASPRVLTDMVFVSQGMIEGVLFQRPAERAKALQSLFGTESAEKLREYLQNELTQVSVASAADEIKSQKERLSRLNAELLQVESELAAAKGECLASAQVDELKLTVEKHRRAEELRESSARLRAECAALEENLKGARAAHAACVDSAAKLEPLVAAVNKLAEPARVELARFDAAQKSAARAQEAMLQLGEVKRVLAAPKPAEPEIDESGLAGYAAKVQLLRQSVELDRKVVDSGLADGVSRCPTCSQLLPQSYVESSRARLKEQVAELQHVEKALQDFSVRRTAQLKLFEEWTRTRIRAEQHKESLEGELSSLADVAPKGDRAELLKIINEAKQGNDTLNKLRTDVALTSQSVVSLDGQLHRRTTDLAQAQERLSGLALGGLVSAEEAAATLDKSNRAEVRWAGLQGKLKVMEEHGGQLEAALKHLEAEEAKLAGKRKYKELLERSRMVLHRDQLPRLVAQLYIKSLNEKLAKYLELFEAPYLARITDDISIQCTFGDRVVPAERLSGGEKVVLGIAFRFAVYELFVSNLGLLILDEPTVYLDSDRIDSVLSLLERVKGYSRSAGLQLIVITHEARLAGVFDQVIEL